MNFDRTFDKGRNKDIRVNYSTGYLANRRRSSDDSGVSVERLEGGRVVHYQVCKFSWSWAVIAYLSIKNEQGSLPFDHPARILPPIDLLFLVDSSSSIGLVAFEQIKQNIDILLKDVDIAPGRSRVAMIQVQSALIFLPIIITFSSLVSPRSSSDSTNISVQSQWREVSIECHTLEERRIWRKVCREWQSNHYLLKFQRFPLLRVFYGTNRIWKRRSWKHLRMRPFRDMIDYRWGDHSTFSKNCWMLRSL